MVDKALPSNGHTVVNIWHIMK